MSESTSAEIRVHENLSGQFSVEEAITTRQARTLPGSIEDYRKRLGRERLIHTAGRLGSNLAGWGAFLISIYRAAGMEAKTGIYIPESESLKYEYWVIPAMTLGIWVLPPFFNKELQKTNLRLGAVKRYLAKPLAER